jgi:hypothetical protein
METCLSTRSLAMGPHVTIYSGDFGCLYFLLTCHRIDYPSALRFCIRLALANILVTEIKPCAVIYLASSTSASIFICIYLVFYEHAQVTKTAMRIQPSLATDGVHK